MEIIDEPGWLLREHKNSDILLISLIPWGVRGSLIINSFMVEVVLSWQMTKIFFID